MEILTGTDGAEEAHWNNGCLIGRGAKMRRDNFTPPLFAASIPYQMRIRSLLLFFSILLISGAVQGQRFYVKLSGKVMQDWNTDDMIFNCRQMSSTVIDAGQGMSPPVSPNSAI